MHLGRVMAGLAVVAAIIFAQGAKPIRSKRRSLPVQPAPSPVVTQPNPDGTVYLNLASGEHLEPGCNGVGFHRVDAGANGGTTEYQSGVCMLHLPPGIYVITVAEPGFRPYTSAPFVIAPGQVIPHQANLYKEAKAGRLTEFLTYYLPVILVIAGLFREQLIRALIHYPRLILDPSEKHPHCHVSTMSWRQLESEWRDRQSAVQTPPSTGQPVGDDGFKVFFCRIFVENKGTGEVTDVEVFVSSMWDLSSGSPVKIDEFLPLNLRWANSWPFYRPQPKVENDEPLHKARISAGIGRFCDLGFIVEPQAMSKYFHATGITPQPENFGTDAVFQFAFETFNTAHGRAANKDLLLELAIDGANMETEFFYVTLKVKGRWNAVNGAQTFEFGRADRGLVHQAGKRDWRIHAYFLTEAARAIWHHILLWF